MKGGNLTPAQVAAKHPHLGDKRTLQRWCREEVVEHERTPSGRFQFTPEQVAKLTTTHAPRTQHPEVAVPNPMTRRGGQLQLVTVKAKPRRQGAA